MPGRVERGLLPLGHEDFVHAELEWVATDSLGFVGPNLWCPLRSGSVVVAVAYRAGDGQLLALWRTSACHCLQMIRERHPSVAIVCVHHLEGQPTDPVLIAAVECPRAVTVSRLLRGMFWP